MFEFLQMVLYKPNPIIIDAKTANGTRMKKLVFLPIQETESLPIKLSVLISSDSE